MVTLFCKTSFILLIFVSFLCINLNAQNLIVNPDFSDVSVFYRDGKKVYPKHWISFHYDYPSFEHRAKRYSEFPPKPGSIQKSQGVILLHIIKPSRGIYTELREELVSGQKYEVNVKVKIFRATVNSDFPGPIREFGTYRIKDSTELNYNHVVDLIVRFHDVKPACPPDTKEKLLFLEFPEDVTPDYTDYINLSTTYVAEGNERYFSIGLCSTDEYISYLRKNKSDTTCYQYKLARYLIFNVSVLLVFDELAKDITFFDSFQSDNINLDKKEEIFIIRNITFDFDCYALNAVSRKELSGLTTFMMSNPERILNIIGHTDSIGSPDYNQVLSENRAKAVYSYLVFRGIDETRLNWEGRGENEPLEGKQYIKNFRMHRRVEFEMLWKEP